MMMHQCIAILDCLLEYTSEKKVCMVVLGSTTFPVQGEVPTTAASDEESCGNSISCSYQVSRLRKNDIFFTRHCFPFVKSAQLQSRLESKAIPAARQKGSANHKTRGTQQQ